MPKVTTIDLTLDDSEVEDYEPLENCRMTI